MKKKRLAGVGVGWQGGFPGENGTRERWFGGSAEGGEFRGENQGLAGERVMLLL